MCGRCCCRCDQSREKQCRETDRDSSSPSSAEDAITTWTPESLPHSRTLLSTPPDPHERFVMVWPRSLRAGTSRLPPATWFKTPTPQPAADFHEPCYQACQDAEVILSTPVREKVDRMITKRAQHDASTRTDTRHNLEDYRRPQE